MKHFVLAACCVAAVSSVSAQAEIYAAGLVGVSSPSESVFDDDKAVRLGLGFRFNEMLSVEANYLDLGAYAMQGDALRMVIAETEFALQNEFPANEVEVTSASVDSLASGLELSLVGQYSLTDAMNLYGRVGIFSWTADLDGSVNIALDGQNEAFSFKEEFDDGTDVVVGLGVSHQVSSALSLQLEWSSYATSDMDNRVLGLGARWHL